MVEYANDSVVKALRQYDMLHKSLKFIDDVEQRNDVCLQMTRIIKQVLNITNTIYEERYRKIVSRSAYLMDDEKNRLLEIINLINERRTYVNNQIDNNKEITGISFQIDNILGEDKLDEYKEQVKIIEKYKNNVKLDSILRDEISNLDVSINKARNKINNNKILNKQLEDRMIKLLERSFDILGLYELKERSKEIDLAYTELGYSLEKAKENAKLARKDCADDIIIECDNMLASITLEYERYKEKKLILNLIDIYNDSCDDYDSLLDKREKINDILNNIVSSDLYKEVGTELKKEYATIKLEQQDAATLDSLLEERENKHAMLVEINEENESEQFKLILSNLLENEKKHQEELLLEQKKKEAKIRERQLLEEKRKQEEAIKHQRLLEEERKKEIERRTKQLLVEKKNPVLITDKDDKKRVNKKEEVTPLVSRKKSTEEIVKRNAGNDINDSGFRVSNDIFGATEKKDNNEKIPVIKNNNVVDVKKVNVDDNRVPKKNLNKEQDIFLDFPDKNDSFFDDNEFEDLNKYVENESSSKSWF